MNNLEVFTELIERFLYQMGLAYTVNIEHAHFYNEDLPNTIFIIKYKVLRYGEIKNYILYYVVSDNDIECEFVYALSSALHYISDEIGNNNVMDYLTTQHDKEVI